MKKKVVILISSLLVIGALLSGCTQGLYSISVLPQNIGDEVTYTVSFTTSTTSTGSYPSEPSTQSTTMNGTIFSKVNGTKTVKDGFGVEKEAVEMYTKTSFDMNSTTQQMPYEYEVSTVTYSYIDLASKVPIKTTTQMDMGLMKMLYEFYVSENMYEFLYSGLSASGMMGGMTGLSPNDISSAFEEKTIQKGDTGTITIMNMTTTWTAVDNENVKGYDCVKIQFDFSMPISSGNISTTVDFTYTIWLADSFPNLIKMSGTITSETTTTFLDTENTYQSSTVINMILDSSKRGQTEIVWGSAEPSFSDTNILGEYRNWDLIPFHGGKNSTVSYVAEIALFGGMFLSVNLSSYLDLHPDAYVIGAKYERKNTTETWELTFAANDTIEGYKIELTHNGTTSILASEESKVFSIPPSPKSSLPQELLTFSGCEYILSQYTNINSSSDMQIQFIADISHQSSTLGSGSVFTSDISEMFPHSLYMIMVGDTQQGATMAIIDAETGQLIMIYIMEGFSFGL